MLQSGNGPEGKMPCPKRIQQGRKLRTRDRALENLNHSAGLDNLADQFRHLAGNDTAECIRAKRVYLLDASKRKTGLRNPDFTICGREAQCMCFCRVVVSL